MSLLRLPRRFFEDHYDRALPTPKGVRWNHQSVWVRADDPNLPDLLSDARFYADPQGWDPEISRTIGRAAQRLLDAYHAQT